MRPSKTFPSHSKCRLTAVRTSLFFSLTPKKVLLLIPVIQQMDLLVRHSNSTIQHSTHAFGCRFQVFGDLFQKIFSPSATEYPRSDKTCLHTPSTTGAPPSFPPEKPFCLLKQGLPHTVCSLPHHPQGSSCSWPLLHHPMSTHKHSTFKLLYISYTYKALLSSSSASM